MTARRPLGTLRQANAKSARRIAQIPTSGPERLAALDKLDYLIARDALTTACALRAAGWGNDETLDDALDGYRDWLIARVADAIDFGICWDRCLR